MERKKESQQTTNHPTEQKIAENKDAKAELTLDEQKAQIQQKVELELEKKHAEYVTQKKQLEIDRKCLTDEIALKEVEKKREDLEFQLTEKRANAEAVKQQQIQNIADRQIYDRKMKREEEEALSRSKREGVFAWLKTILILLLFIFFIAFLCLALYRAYRWVTEEPLVREVQTVVEIVKEVDKIVEVEIEKEVKVIEIPEECTQIRRNGKIFISCDGVNVDGVPTIGDSGLNDIPDLLTG